MPSVLFWPLTSWTLDFNQENGCWYIVPGAHWCVSPTFQQTATCLLLQRKCYLEQQPGIKDPWILIVAFPCTCSLLHLCVPQFTHPGVIISTSQGCYEALLPRPLSGRWGRNAHHSQISWLAFPVWTLSWDISVGRSQHCYEFYSLLSFDAKVWGIYIESLQARLDMTCGRDQIWEALLLFLRQLQLLRQLWTKGVLSYCPKPPTTTWSISLPPWTLNLWTAKSHWRLMQVHMLAAYEMPVLSVTQSGPSYSTTGTSRETFAGFYLKGRAEKSNF